MYGMTKKVGLKEKEYLELARQVKKVHKSSLTAVDNALKKIEALNCADGGFYTKEITPKISELLQEIKGMTQILEDAFSVHEQIIDSFQSAIANYDVYR